LENSVSVPLEVRVMAQKKDSPGGGSAKSTSKKISAKKAKKAIARAEESVAEARKAVRALKKKLRKRVSQLAEQTARLSAEQSRALKKVDAAAGEAAVPESRLSAAAEGQTSFPDPLFALTAVPPSPPTSSEGEDGEEADTALTPPLPKPQPPAGTLVELRQRAREQKIPGYSRMSKASLMAALEAAPQG
jgi:hypothetical protein